MSVPDDDLIDLLPRTTPLTDPMPTRSGATSITDDELLLMDALFQCFGISEHQLTASEYHFHMNVGYTNGLSNEEVLNTLNRWKGAGLVIGKPYPDNGESLWELSEEGGRIWEAERQPLWDQYVMYTGYFDDQITEDYPDVDPAISTATWESPLRVILSPNLDVVTAYTATAIAIGLCVPTSKDRFHYVFNNATESYKHFDTLHAILLHSEGDDDVRRVDWKLYETQRIWWVSISELDSLRHKLADER